MKESKKIVILLLIMIFVIAACGKRKESQVDSGKMPNKNTKEVEIYYVNSDGSEISSKKVEIRGDLSDGIVSALISEGILEKGCAVNQVSVESSSKKMTIDINRVFGERIRSMGTTGEEEILQCTARTYLDAYQCEKILITEEGNVLETGHSVIEDYVSYK